VHFRKVVTVCFGRSAMGVNQNRKHLYNKLHEGADRLSGIHFQKSVLVRCLRAGIAGVNLKAKLARVEQLLLTNAKLERVAHKVTFSSLSEETTKQSLIQHCEVFTRFKADETLDASEKPNACVTSFTRKV